MENLFETIRAALASEANDETRAAGVVACRTLINVIEARPGEPIPAPVPPAATSQAPESPAPQIAAAISALRGVPAEQLLDMAIARLRAALPAGTTVPQVQPLKIPLIQLPKVGGGS